MTSLLDNAGYREKMEKAIDVVVEVVTEEGDKFWKELWPNLENENLKKLFVAMIYANAAKKMEKTLNGS